MCCRLRSMSPQMLAYSSRRGPATSSVNVCQETYVSHSTSIRFFQRSPISVLACMVLRRRNEGSARASPLPLP